MIVIFCPDQVKSDLNLTILVLKLDNLLKIRCQKPIRNIFSWNFVISNLAFKSNEVNFFYAILFKSFNFLSLFREFEFSLPDSKADPFPPNSILPEIFRGVLARFR